MGGSREGEAAAGRGVATCLARGREDGLGGGRGRGRCTYDGRRANARDKMGRASVPSFFEK